MTEDHQPGQSGAWRADPQARVSDALGSAMVADSPPTRGARQCLRTRGLVRWNLSEGMPAVQVTSEAFCSGPWRDVDPWSNHEASELPRSAGSQD
jgi:hypothetical protein